MKSLPEIPLFTGLSRACIMQIALCLENIKPARTSSAHTLVNFMVRVQDQSRADRMVTTLRYVFLCLLICPGVFALCSKKLESNRTRHIIQKLCSLGDMRPARCKTEAENMTVQRPKFPNQEEIRLPVLEMSFRVVSDLLMKNTSTKWRSSELQQLQGLLGHQRQYYTECVPVVSSARAEVENWSAFWSSLSDFLSEKSFSSCAWESARTVILDVMRTFYKYTAKPLRLIRSC